MLEWMHTKTEELLRLVVTSNIYSFIFKSAYKYIINFYVYIEKVLDIMILFFR